MTIIDRITELAVPLVEKQGAKIVDITYTREGHTNVLRLLVDKGGGISMRECGAINSNLSLALDEANIPEEQYILEVSSPGLDRELKTARDFEWALGRKVKVTTSAPIGKENVFVGDLVGSAKEAIVLQSKEGIATEIPLAMIAKARLHEL
ncbi:MAG: ribosome maturation factor RimP [Candidatus Omnitrophica bacterium]|nr:ribosome maturation factor RimP [Candidatus Omnitrophota bacterium]